MYVKGQGYLIHIVAIYKILVLKGWVDVMVKFLACDAKFPSSNTGLVTNINRLKLNKYVYVLSKRCQLSIPVYNQIF